MLRTFLGIGLWLVILLLRCEGAAQQGPTVPAQAQQPSAASANSSSASPAEQRTMKEDLRRMQVILDQMRTNLAFVGNSTTPLNHQLQLEIDMWQALLDHMNQGLESHPQATPAQ